MSRYNVNGWFHRLLVVVSSFTFSLVSGHSCFRWRWPCVLLFAVAVWMVRPAWAQSPPIEASIRAAQARAAARRGDIPEAIRLYRTSIELNPTPRVLRELAELLERQGALRAAADAWTRYAALAPQASERDMAIVRREALRRTPSLLRVRVSPSLAARQARVWFDRDPPRPVPVGGAESFVEGGTHRVRVESPGFVPFETMVTTAYGEPMEVIARMQPLEVSAGSVREPRDAGTTAPRQHAPNDRRDVRATSPATAASPLPRE